MAALLTGIMTTLGRKTLAKSFASLAQPAYPVCRAKYFKIGMGGYTILGNNKVPKDPDPSLTDVEATGAPGDYFFQKNFTDIDIVFIEPSIIQLRCRLEPLEANDDGTGNPPRFFEIGIFDENDNMIIYTTFNEQTKESNKIVTNFVQVYF